MAAEFLRSSDISDGVVSSYRSLGVYWRQPPVDTDQRIQRIKNVIREHVAIDPKRLLDASQEHFVEALYDGPDIGTVAEHCGLSVAEVIRRHSETRYVVAAVGFMPHFAYLWGMDSSLATPRRNSPRVRVPLGALGIANDQTGIYPCESPGGWQLIGQVEASLCRRVCRQLNIGDVVRFVDKKEKAEC
jgi:KipI family sensor histidine kinase inhibitor